MKKAKTIRKYNRIITFPIDTKNCKVSINNIILSRIFCGEYYKILHQNMKEDLSRYKILFYQ